MIGVFDSGIGGLTVVRALMDRQLEHDIIYFGDTARTPYGTKSPATVIDYALENTEFLLEMGAQIIVIACNTASSVATEAIQKKFDLPLFEVITPAVEYSLEVSRKLNIGVVGTRATINSGVYKAMIRKRKPDAKVFSVACPLLVPLVEEGWLKKPETRMIVKKYLHPLKVRQIDTLILGCTHYPFLKDIIQKKAGQRVRIVDSSVCVAGKVEAYLEQHPEMDGRLSKNKKLELYVSDITDQFEKVAKSALKRRVNLKHIKL